MVDPDSLPMKGICDNCGARDNCPMVYMLKEHRRNVEIYETEFYEDIAPDAWDECSIDEPEANGSEITWCPMYE